MRRALSFLLRTLLVFAIVEGACSLLLMALVVPLELRPPLAERIHTRYDEELGWVNVPGRREDDMYGPGVALTINSQGFRGDRDFADRVPDGFVRIVCLGDSFTLGYGVGDDETWCAQLAALDPRLETVNMGQGGYGVDQAYLWYARDGDLRHQILVLAVIAEDFRRMLDDVFYGYGKPVLRVAGDQLVTANVPVPRRGYRFPWLTQNLDLAAQLRSVELARTLLGSRGPAQPTIDEERLGRLTRAVLRELSARVRERGARTLIVYLPTREEYTSAHLESWVPFIARHAREQGLPLLDLRQALRQLPPRRVDALFIPQGALTYPHAAGHYTAEGNAWVARQLYARLRDWVGGPTP